MNDNKLIVLDQQGIEDLLAAHRLWKDSHGKEGQFPSFNDMILREMDVSGVDMMEAQFHDSRLEHCRFVGANVSSSIIMQTVADDCDFSQAELVKAQIAGSKFCGCRFEATNLTRAFFLETDLRDTLFTGANLRGAAFVNCDLRNAVFDGVDLHYTDIVDCRTDGASWVGAAPPPVFKTDSRSAR